MEIIDHFKTSSPDIYSILEENARRMRSQPTEAEMALWQCVRGEALGVKFRRQHPIGDYIVDFVCLKSKLVVEVDGGYHFTSEQKRLDDVRTEALAKMGYRELRFTNEDVLFNTDFVIDTIKNNL